MTKYGATLPLKIRQYDESFGITDASDRAIAFFYFEEDPSRRLMTKKLGPDEAKECAKQAAKALTFAIRAEGGEG